MFYELAALGAAASWAISSLFAAGTTREIGGIAFTMLRVYFACAMLFLITIPLGFVQDIPGSAYLVIILSGVAGLVLGDVALFITFRRLGPRRAQILYISNAPFTVLLGVLFLHESVTRQNLYGILLVTAGVLIAIIWGKRRSQIHTWESVQGNILIGVFFGLLSGFGQALGSLIIKPVLDQGVHPLGAATIRMATASVVLFFLGRIFWPKIMLGVNKKHLAYAAINGFLAIVVGMTFLLWAFAHGNIGVASVLSAMTPVLVLPLLWIKTKERPAAAAWMGALIAMIGCGFIALN